MIKINWSDIRKDVEKQTWRIAQVIFTDEETKANAQEDESKASMNFIVRFAEEGVSLIKTALRENLVSVTPVDGDDSINRNIEGWEFALTNSIMVEEKTLAMLIHKFIVDYILFRWCRLWAQNYAQTFESDYKSDEKAIMESAFNLGFPIKKKRPPYPDYETKIEVEYD